MDQGKLFEKSEVVKIPFLISYSTFSNRIGEKLDVFEVCAHNKEAAKKAFFANEPENSRGIIMQIKQVGN